jgi:G3E family GTPase
MTRSPEPRIPVHLLTGFLGSGKTTLLNRVLRAPGMDGTLVIVNEFGKVGLDHFLIETPEDETILLSNGCLCCAMLGDLVLTLTRLAERIEAGEIPAVQRIVIETTGLADPVPLLRTLQDDAFIGERFMLSGVVTVVDGCSGAADLASHREALKQATVADRLAISKTDIAEAEAVAALAARLAEINPGTEIRTAAIADVEIAELFRRSGEQHVSLSWLAAPAETKGQGDHHRRHHHGSDAISTFSARHELPVSAEGLRLWLNALGRFRGPNLLRMKGLINVEGRPVVVHAVQQVISEPVTLPAWPSGDRASQLVFITQGLSRTELESTFAAFSVTPAEDRIGDLAFGPESYGRFIAALENFGVGERLG